MEHPANRSSAPATSSGISAYALRILLEFGNSPCGSPHSAASRRLRSVLWSMARNSRCVFQSRLQVNVAVDNATSGVQARDRVRPARGAPRALPKPALPPIRPAPRGAALGVVSPSCAAFLATMRPRGRWRPRRRRGRPREAARERTPRRGSVRSTSGTALRSPWRAGPGPQSADVVAVSNVDAQHGRHPKPPARRTKSQFADVVPTSVKAMRVTPFACAHDRMSSTDRTP